MKIRDVTDEQKCCCSCANNKREQINGRCRCHCSIDGHRIGYVDNFEKTCEEWKKAEWEKEKGDVQCGS